ncbi:MAG TPA: hypothetical protein VEX38_01455, partial [Fimbriimonadaceae bacterium]|nr:hypothetical protein [Fimbriimonadaceae bacterium]
MQQNPWARIGVYFSSGDVFALHYREVLDHAGLHVQELDSLTPSDLAGVDVLLLCGYGSLGETTVQAVQDWVFAGGALVCGGSSWGLDAVLGLSGGEQHVSNSTLGATRPSNHWPREAESVRFFGGRLKKAGVCEVLASCGDDLVGLSSRFFGRGLGTFFGVHLGQTIATMQTGLAVECDGIGPGDESARLDDGVLRAEDGIALRFEDRTTVDGAEHPFFGRAHADILKDIWIRSVLHSVDHVGAKVAIFWHWPRHANAVGCLTLDCENFEPEKVALVRRVLIMYGCRAAWLVAMPGYSIDIYRSIKAWDNELGVLFLVDNHSGWHEDKFKIQLTAMSRLAGLPGLTSVRPQDGRWRGWTSFYELCEEAGARISLSKGGRQPGTNGFPFGTCHP